MNKKLYFLALSLLSMTGVYAQLANTGILKVNAGTLLYTSTGTDFQQSGVAAVTTNNGRIQVNGNFQPGTDPTKFVNVFVNSTDYGQLIVDDAININTTNKITQQTRIQQKAAYAFSHISFPFQNYTISDFVFGDLGLAGSLVCPIGNFGTNCFHATQSYMNNALYFWDNNFVEYGNVVSNYTGSIGGGYRMILNNVSNTFFDPVTTANNIYQLTGTPENKALNAAAVFPFNPFSSATFTPGTTDWWAITTPFPTAGRNRRVQLWTDVLEDGFRVGDVDRYRWIYNLGNPYTSNIDLSFIGITGGTNDTDGINIPILAVEKLANGVVLSGNQYVGSGAQHTALFETAAGPNQGRLTSGSIESLLIRPYETFKLVGRAAIPGFNFSDGLKTFSSTPKAIDANQDGTIGDNDTDGIPLNGQSFGGKTRKFREASFPTLASLSIGLQVFDDENDQLGSMPVFVVANQSVQSNKSLTSGYYNNSVSDSDLLYAINDSIKGFKFKILGLKMDEYKKVPIGFKAPENGDGKYIFKTGAHRMIRFGGDDSAYPTLYSFYDAKLDKTIPIDKDFSYAFTQESDTENRFFILYNSKLEIVDPVVNLGNTKTQIAKEGSDNYLLIGTDTKVENPMIQVYSSAGQLLDVFSSGGEKKVKLKNYAPGVYLVRVEGLLDAVKLISYN